MSKHEQEARAGRITTHRHGRLSVFQSLVEDVVERIDGRAAPGDGGPGDGGSRDGGSRDGGQGASSAPSGRPTAGDLSHDLGHRIADFQERGEPIPERPPRDLREKHGGAIERLWTCGRLAAQAAEARAAGRSEEAAAKADELKFSSCDPHWASSLTEYLRYFGVDGQDHQVPYVRHQHMDDFVLESLPADAKIALLGDWGTGTEDAIRTLEQIAAHEPDALVHLGDIYYSGTPRETHRYFLDIVERVLRRDGRAVPVYTLAGNHDMYSGGEGFYQLLPELNPEPTYRPEQAQPASYFSLRSIDGAWQLLAMDTGLHDRDPFRAGSEATYLEPSEEAWHVDKVRRFSAAGGRTILLSHHQLFSAFENPRGRSAAAAPGEEAANPKLLASFRQMQQAAAEAAAAAATTGSASSAGSARAEEPIAAWFWGHEHNLDVYQPYLGLAKGRCIGHGAIPAFVEADPYAVLDTLSDPPRLVDDPARPGTPLRLAEIDRVYAHGFVLIELDDSSRTATASYYQETNPDEPMFVETL